MSATAAEGKRNRRAVPWPFVVIGIAIAILAVVGAGILLAPPTPTSTEPTAMPIGAAFAFGFASTGNCTAALATERTCVTTGDFLYEVSVHQYSRVPFDGIRLDVSNSSGGVFHNAGEGEFSVINASGALVTSYLVVPNQGLEMTSGWSSYYGNTSGGTALTSKFSFILDTGQSTSTAHQGLTLTANGQNGFQGTETISLP